MPHAGWSYGTSLSYLRELVAYWRRDFDWRAQERRLNAFASFRARVGGLAIHFVHERGRGPAPLPLVLTHGWPSTFAEMLRLVPLLTDPAAHGADPRDAFDVVAPSLPGYGFSEAPRREGFVSADVADLWARLMTEVLGYARFGAHGGDIGAGVTTRLGGGDLERRFTKDELLTNVTLYWATQTIGSSIRFYRESRVHARPLGPDERVRVPTAVALFPKDLLRPPRSWAERTYDVARWTEMRSGGHFAALEEPELLAADLRAFFRPLRGEGGRCRVDLGVRGRARPRSGVRTGLRARRRLGTALREGARLARDRAPA